MCRVLTLLYHRVNDLKYDKNLLAVNLNNFYTQMSYLKKNYPIVRFEQNWNELDEDAVCITFDDGYMDNITNALPILRDLNIPATIFVATGNINTFEEFWWDELERILLNKEKNFKPVFALDDDLFSCQWPTETFYERENLYDTLHWLMYDKITVNKRKDWIEQLRKWANVGRTGRKENQGLQTDVSGVDSSLLTIGAHTVNHPSLKNLSKQDQVYEIVQSVKDLEALFNRKITVFSYPFGTRNDFDTTAIDICKDAHIHKAAANYPGIWNSRINEFQIPRNIIRNWGINEYIQRVEAFWNTGQLI